jgi:two-component system NarL family response regulator
VKVLLVDDHSLFVSGLQNLLDAAGITVVGTARDGLAAVSAARKLQPDVILMDIQMPGCDGLTATKLIKDEFPNIQIVMLTMTDEDHLIFEAIKCGASGFLLKNLEADDFFNQLSRLNNGETVFSPGVARRILNEFAQVKTEKPPAPLAPKAQVKSRLTPRQEEVLVHIARGLSYKEIAALLHVSEVTVKYHLSEILQRLQLENRAQAIAYAVQTQLSGVID